MASRHAKPGETILITRKGAKTKGHRFLVLVCPDEYKNGCNSHCAWFLWNGGIWYGEPEDYDIVDNLVDDNLKNRLNDNLRDVFG